MTLMGVAFAGNERCANGNNSIAGLYTGIVTFIDNSTEPLSINIHEDHSFTVVGRYEFPSFVGSPGVSDLESPLIGQWKSNCDKTYRLSGLQRRQAGAGGGTPALFGYTTAQIPSLPNYTLVLSGNFTVSKAGKMKFVDLVAGFGDANYPLPNGVLLPFTSVFPVISFELQKQSIDGLYDAIPK